MNNYEAISKELKKYSVKKSEEFLPKFFKTGKGEYGEGDIFIGVTNPNAWAIAKQSIDTEFTEIKKLIHSKIHEERTVALMILVLRMKKTKLEIDQKNIVYFYLDNLEGVNNWDLVDVSCPTILGTYLLDKDKSVLYKLAKSKSLWKERIAMVTTLWFVRYQKLDDAIKIADILLDHKHDLIHKAVGWVLREVGKKDEKVLEKYLQKNYKNIPRTTLRYAIEKFPELKRKRYLRGEFK